MTTHITPNTPIMELLDILTDIVDRLHHYELIGDWELHHITERELQEFVDCLSAEQREQLELLSALGSGDDTSTQRTLH